jgi:hypothetical protein
LDQRLSTDSGKILKVSGQTANGRSYFETARRGEY